MFSAAKLLQCHREGYEATQWSVLFCASDFSSLFVQAFQQSTAASLTGPRSGNPGYIVGKPLLALTGDKSHSVSFLGLG